MPEVKLVGGPFDQATAPVSDPKGHILVHSENRTLVPEGHTARYEFDGVEGEMRYQHLTPTITIPMPGGKS